MIADGRMEAGPNLGRHNVIYCGYAEKEARPQAQSQARPRARSPQTGGRLAAGGEEVVGEEEAREGVAEVTTPHPLDYARRVRVRPWRDGAPKRVAILVVIQLAIVAGYFVLSALG